MIRDKVNMIKQNLLGILGLVLLCVGVAVGIGITQNILNVIGISMLIIYAKQGKNEFFFYLESVVLLGTVLKIADVNNNILIMSLIIATLLALFKVLKNAEYRKADTVIGIIGLLGLVYGYSTLSSYGYAIGGIALAIFSLIGYCKGIKSALIFMILNVFFASIAIYTIIS